MYDDYLLLLLIIFLDLFLNFIMQVFIVCRFPICPLDYIVLVVAQQCIVPVSQAMNPSNESIFVTNTEAHHICGGAYKFKFITSNSASIDTNTLTQDAHEDTPGPLGKHPIISKHWSECIGVLRYMQRYFSYICDGTDVQAD